jgi:anti-sigma-K factor RskA
MNARGHDIFEGSAAAYALGVLEEREVAPFEEHLEGCAQCQEELASMREAVGSLALAASPAPPPSRVKERVMADVRGEVAPSPARTPRRVARPAWLRPGIAAGALAAVAALALVLVLTTGGGGSGRTFAGITHARGASASIRVSGGAADLVVSRLPAPPAGRIYQVWLKRAAAAPVPTHALFATTNGSVSLPGNLAGVQAVLVTAEPRPDGSRSPTRAPIIVVRLT